MNQGPSRNDAGLYGRSAGILVHPSSFPSPYGIGDLGPSAYQFVTWMAQAHLSVWQILPLAYPDEAGSPYSSPSTFAGNPLLISPEELLRDGLVDTPDVERARVSVANVASPVDFPAVARTKWTLLEAAFARFQSGPARPELSAEFQEFRHQHTAWLEPHVTFMALSRARGSMDWTRWPRQFASFAHAADWLQDDAAETISAETVSAETISAKAMAREMEFQAFVQFLFFHQWHKLREYARQHHVYILGDMPIYVDHASADVWSHQHLFDLDEGGQPRHVAGVPPDYFSATGQLWGNALYDWKAMQSEGYAWWIARMHTMLHCVDLIRLDHFRGLQDYWAVPASEETAMHGAWCPGPAERLLERLCETCASDTAAPLLRTPLPVVAEDLGLITPDVIKLRKRFHLPGMTVLQFVLIPLNPADRFFLEGVEEDSVIYTGTHDNDTMLGWYRKAIEPHEEARAQVQPHIGDVPDEVPWRAIELAWSSRAFLSIAPLQDFLALDSAARLNTPATTEGNWKWRFSFDELAPELQQRIRELTDATNRWMERCNTIVASRNPG